MFLLEKRNEIKNRGKSALLIILAAVMVCNIFTLFDFSVNATTSRTQQEAVNWINSAVGQYFDYDGEWGAQCVDLIYYYYDYLGTWARGGNAVDYAYNSLPDGWSRIQYYDGFVAQPGDIAVFLGPTVYGHVALVSAANQWTMDVVEQNHDGSGSYPANTFTYSYTGSMNFYGVIRPNFPGGSSSDETKYTDITPGIYYLKNKQTGKYMYVSGGVDANTQNIAAGDYVSGDAAYQFEITKASNGYIMRPLVCASRVVNAWGDNPVSGSNVNIYDNVNDATQWWKFESASGGYIIHNVYASSCVLDNDGSNVYILSRHGGDYQIWFLQTQAEADRDNQPNYPPETDPPVPPETDPPHTECPPEIMIPGNNSLVGDVNGDGSVDNRDITRLMRYLAGLIPQDQVTASADVNGDGSIDNRDITRLMRMLVGLSDEPQQSDDLITISVIWDHVGPYGDDESWFVVEDYYRISLDNGDCEWKGDSLYDTSGNLILTKEEIIRCTDAGKMYTEYLINIYRFDGRYSIEFYEANYWNYGSFVTYLDGGFTAKIVKNGNEVYNGYVTAYRSYTGAWVCGVCTIDHGEIKEYDSSWMQQNMF